MDQWLEAWKVCSRCAPAVCQGSPTTEVQVRAHSCLTLNSDKTTELHHVFQGGKCELKPAQTLQPLGQQATPDPSRDPPYPQQHPCHLGKGKCKCSSRLQPAALDLQEVGARHTPHCPSGICRLISFSLSLSFFFNTFILFIYLFMAALGLRCWVQAFSSCSERGLLFVVVRGLLIAVASLVAEHGL